MVRKLPWSTDVGAQQRSLTSTSTRAPKSRRRRVSPGVSCRSDDGLERTRSDARRRHASSSPIPSPPQEELMIEGLDGDDAWVMVEDEFLTTAQLFTRHLHHAEYKRLKSHVKSYESSFIQSISRPITSSDLRLGGEARKRNEAFDLKARQKETLDLTSDGDSKGEELWAHDSGLAGLMAGPKECSQELGRLSGFRPPSRTFVREPTDFSTTTSSRRRRDQEDDSKRLPVSRVMIKTEPSGSIRKGSPYDFSGAGHQSRVKSANVVTRERVTSSRAESKYSFDEATRPRRSSPDIKLEIKREEESLAAAERLAKRRARLAKKDGGKKDKKPAYDEMPTFMF